MILKLLETAPPTSTHHEAFAQLSGIINESEDRLSGVPYSPDAWQADGRIYPPMADSGWDLPDHPGVIRYRTRRHRVFIAENGAIEIQRLDGTVEITKRGDDQRGVWDR